jgi:hypothetical protein
MPGRQRRKPEITPQWFLDRIDYQLYAATYRLRRLKKSFEPDAEEFQVNVEHELRELGRRVHIALKCIKQLEIVPMADWKR